MKKEFALKLLVLLALVFVLGSCSRKTCPAYSQVEVQTIEYRA